LWEIAAIGATSVSDRHAPVSPSRAITEWTTFSGHTNHVNSVAFTPDGKTLATASSDGTAKLWDVEVPP
jgi:WD40 repeat protein